MKILGQFLQLLAGADSVCPLLMISEIAASKKSLFFQCRMKTAQKPEARIHKKTASLKNKKTEKTAGTQDRLFPVVKPGHED